MIARANFYQFRPGENLGSPCVKSRMFLWCKSGQGCVTVNDQRHPLVAGAYLFMPWAHKVLYEPDGQRPFLVGGIHIIPFQKAGEPVEFAVSHHPGDAMAGLKSRKDVFWPRLQGLVHGTLEEGRLFWLASYIVDVFDNVGADEPTMRSLGRLIVQEIAISAQSSRTNGRPMPAALRRMQEFIRLHLDGELTVGGLATIGECSIPSVHRLFRRFLNTAPHQFVAQRRAEEAKRLLRTTVLPVSRIGAQVGFEDPFHFSRFFKRQTGFSPSVYRRRVPIF